MFDLYIYHILVLVIIKYNGDEPPKKNKDLFYNIWNSISCVRFGGISFNIGGRRGGCILRWRNIKIFFTELDIKFANCKYPSLRHLQLCILFVWANKYFVYLVWYGTLSWKQLGVPFCCWLIAGSITILCTLSLQLALGGSILNLDETVSYFSIAFSGFAQMPPHMCIECRPTSL